MLVPLKVMQLAMGSMEVLKAMAETGNPNSASDAGVGALCARTAVRGAWLNVKINEGGLTDREKAGEIMNEAASIAEIVETLEKEILEIVEEKMK
jgi:glutamate formiminotransferase/formiminotetrahydrofolate cyclodeaminase